MATKLWITESHKVIVCNNNLKIPQWMLNRMIRIVETNSEQIIQAWIDHFGEITYYC